MKASSILPRLTDAFETLSDIFIASVLWLVCSLPLVTIASASAALYISVLKTIRYKQGHISSNFFEAFRENWRQGIALSLVMDACIALAACYFFFGGSISAESRLFLIYWLVVLISSIILGAMMAHLTALFSRFSQTSSLMLRSAFLLTLGYPLKSLALGLLLGLCVLIVIIFPLALMALPALFAFLASKLQEPILIKHSPDQQKPGWMTLPDED